MDILFARVLDSLKKTPSRIPLLSTFETIVLCIAVFAFIQLIRMSRKQVHTPRLRGPPSPNFAYGVGKLLMEADNPASLYESWARVYGGVYEVPSTLGSHNIVLCDPKAITHFHSKDTWTYVRSPLTKMLLRRGIGRGLFWAEGESHKRQRKSLTPAFSISAIRTLTPIFFDSAHKAQGAWNALIESSGGNSAIIDVHGWMNYISLDTMGLAGFSHDFGALDGKHALVTEILDTFASSPRASALNIGLDLLGQAFPFLSQLPTRRSTLMRKLNFALEEISNVLLARMKKEQEMGVTDTKEETSIIGLLIKGASADSEFHLSREEVLSQMKVLLLAGYETTSISMTWALIELSRNPDIQTKLRNELLEHESDPTYDELTNTLPYLDAVVHEILRIHPAVQENVRIAAEDDVIPLSEPIRTKEGQLVNNLTIAKGTSLVVPFPSINLSSIIWGEDAKVFNPSQWLEGNHGENRIPAKAREVQGHRHLLTFADGPRICLGKNFALTEFKAVLSVLIKNFVFEWRDSMDTKIEMTRGFLPRPRLAGENGCKVPLRVKPYMG